MEFVDFILNMEGIKDFYLVFKMMDEIMEEIVENVILVSEVLGLFCESSLLMGEVLYCLDILCG